MSKIKIIDRTKPSERTNGKEIFDDKAVEKLLKNILKTA